MLADELFNLRLSAKAAQNCAKSGLIRRGDCLHELVARLDCLHGCLENFGEDDSAVNKISEGLNVRSVTGLQEGYAGQ